MFERKQEQHQDMEKYYEEDIDHGIEKAEKSMMRYRAFLKRLKKLGIKGRYLEIGSGFGILADAIVQENPDIEITALEISGTMIRAAKRYAGKKKNLFKIRFVEGDAENEKTIRSLGKFDLIYSTYSLHHWKDPVKVISNCLNALTDNGVLYIYDLRRVWWLYCIPAENGFFKSIRAAYNKIELMKMLESMGLRNYRIQSDSPFMQSLVCKK